MELHFGSQHGGPDDVQVIMEFARDLFLRGQYLLIDRHDNLYCQHCTEILIKRFHCES